MVSVTSPKMTIKTQSSKEFYIEPSPKSKKSTKYDKFMKRSIRARIKDQRGTFCNRSKTAKSTQFRERSNSKLVVPSNSLKMKEAMNYKRSLTSTKFRSMQNIMLATKLSTSKSIINIPLIFVESAKETEIRRKNKWNKNKGRRKKADSEAVQKIKKKKKLFEIKRKMEASKIRNENFTQKKRTLLNRRWGVATKSLKELRKKAKEESAQIATGKGMRPGVFKKRIAYEMKINKVRVEPSVSPVRSMEPSKGSLEAFEIVGKDNEEIKLGLVSKGSQGLHRAQDSGRIAPRTSRAHQSTPQIFFGDDWGNQASFGAKEEQKTQTVGKTTQNHQYRTAGYIFPNNRRIGRQIVRPPSFNQILIEDANESFTSGSSGGLDQNQESNRPHGVDETHDDGQQNVTRPYPPGGYLPITESNNASKDTFSLHKTSQGPNNNSSTLRRMYKHYRMDTTKNSRKRKANQSKSRIFLLKSSRTTAPRKSPFKNTLRKIDDNREQISKAMRFMDTTKVFRKRMFFTEESFTEGGAVHEKNRLLDEQDEYHLKKEKKKIQHLEMSDPSFHFFGGSHRSNKFFKIKNMRRMMKVVQCSHIDLGSRIESTIDTNRSVRAPIKVFGVKNKTLEAKSNSRSKSGVMEEVSGPAYLRLCERSHRTRGGSLIAAGSRSRLNLSKVENSKEFEKELLELPGEARGGQTGVGEDGNSEWSKFDIL